MRRGIFGGSFNPVHTGHAIIASYIMQHSDLDQLWLMVAPQNPLKEPSPLQPADEHRLRMTELVTRRIAGVVTSAFEFSLPRPSYTITTLRALQEKFPDDTFVLVIGADNWALFDKWKDNDALVSEFEVMIYPRLGYDIEIPDRLKDRVKVVNAPIVEVSSTIVRETAASGGDISFYVTDDVREYIIQHKLYQPND